MRIKKVIIVSATLALSACGDQTLNDPSPSSVSSSSRSSSSLNSSSSSPSSHSSVSSSSDALAAESELVGWALDSSCGPKGTTGGGSGDPEVIVINNSEFIAAMTSDGPKVIGVKGKLGGQMSITAKDKTVIGIGSNAQIDGGFKMSASKNIIFKNMTFSGGKKGQSIDDAFELSGSTCFWFDHSTFRDGGDGNLDMVRGTDFATVSWSKFYYTFGHGHMLSNLIGNDNKKTSDRGKLNITFHHNLWGAGVRSRQPFVRFGKVHVFNNLYSYKEVSGGGGSNYAVGNGIESKLLVENNYFENVNRVWSALADNGTGQIVAKGNKVVNSGGSFPSRGDSFTPPYKYTLESADDIKAKILTGAGPKENSN